MTSNASSRSSMSSYSRTSMSQSSIARGQDRAPSKSENKDPRAIGFEEFTAIQRKLIAEEDCEPSVKGVVSVTVRVANFVQVNKLIDHNAYVYCAISTRNFTKKTRVVHSHNSQAVWDQRKLFPVTVPRNRKHPFNIITVRVFTLDPTDLEHQTERGSVSFHLHDIIPVSPIKSTYDLWDDTLLVGEINLEVTFNYGEFGYGYSVQMLEPNVEADDLVRYSLFPRINPMPDETDFESHVLQVKAVAHPSFIPFKSRVHLSYGKEIGESLYNSQPQRNNPSFMAQEELEELTKFRDKYYDINDRPARLLMLYRRIAETSAPDEAITTSTDPLPDSESNHPYGYSRFVQPVVALRPRKDSKDFLAATKRRMTNAFVGEEVDVVESPRHTGRQGTTPIQDAWRKFKDGPNRKDARVHPM